MSPTVFPRRFLMVHYDGAGNVPPQRALARELVRRGHEVHVLSHSSIADSLRSDGAIFHPLSGEPPFSASKPLPPVEEMAVLARTILFSKVVATDFEAVAEAVKPDGLLIDDTLFSVLRRCVGRPTPTVALHHLIFNLRLVDPFMRKVITETCPAALVFSYRAFSPEPTITPSVHFVGPIREPSAAPVWTRRQSDRPFVLVSLSTSFQNQHAVLQRICAALAPLAVEALVTTGPNMPPERFEAGDAVELREFVPHDRVMPIADLVITHAGHGTVMAAAGAGVPMLCLPMGRDQPDVAGRVKALGLGRVIRPQASTETIREAVVALLADPAQRATSRAFAAGVSRFGDLTRAAEIVEAVAGSKADSSRAWTAVRATPDPPGTASPRDRKHGP
jgi:UDP:flavonoid glycosyltransferase YjiC (YdhE family)